jgi:hypothetical protein
MESQKTMHFSDMKLSEASIKFEKEQLGLYTDLVNRHPENEFFKKAQSQLNSLIEDHEKQLGANSGTKPC